VGLRWRAVLVLAALGLGLLALVSVALASTGGPVEITIRYSRFEPVEVTVPAGRPVTFVLRNEDPIDHEWIVGDAALHERHRTGTEPIHDSRPTEVTVPALETRTTTITFDRPGELSFICHLPGHEAYGMAGVLRVVGS
jgi:uncharacterized cupredoxin-like copper-binding protein